MIQFIIPGEPHAKGRPRAMVRGGHVHTYTPEKTERYESRVALFAREAMRGGAPLEGPLVVEVRAVMPIPRSWSIRKQAQASRGEIRPTSRPDLDNIAKAVTDGANAILWRDDSQIVELRLRKVYGEQPCVEVRVAVAAPAVSELFGEAA